jgi:ubiquinone/menaquinone biosynthesis C-methylase UbiE
MADVLIHTAFARSVGASIMKWKDGPPKRVLDIGCGVGHWVTDMALQWPDTEFVGLDLVPIQKSLPVFDRATSNVDGDDAVVGSAVDLQKRITWVVANALEGLPFPSKSFDFVHIRFLNDGVPERKWPKLLTEVTRVLAPQGQLELIELDFSFFGSPMRMRTTDLMDLILGRLNGDMSEGLSCWPVKPKNREDLEASKRNAGLHAILRQTLNRRGINLNPTSILPFYINALDGVQSTSHTDLRQIPILARSHRRTFGQIRPSSAGGRGASSSSSSTSFGSLDTMTRKDEQLESSIDALLGLNFVEGAHAFSSHPHMKNNVPDVHIRVQDLDALRMAIMQADTLRITDNKHVFWQEVESLRKQLAHEAVKASGLPTSDSGSSLGSRASKSGSSLRVTSHEANVAACVKRWPDSATFERDLDFWQADMQDRTDVDSLLRHKMRGGDAANRMDGWQQLESLRKKAQRGRRMTFDDEDQGRSHDSPVDLMHTTASSSDSADSSSPVKKEQQQQLGAVSSASSSVKAALSETTEILGFRTASFYVVQRNDDKSPHGSPTKRLSQISAASVTPSGSGLIG